MAKNQGKLNIEHLLLKSVIDLTLSDRRLYNYLLHNAFDRLDKQLDFKIALSELTGVYGIGLPPIDSLKESIRRLIRTLVEFESAPSDWKITSLLERAELDELGGVLHYSYPLYCRQLFESPFTLERCLIQAHFTHKYSNLLYETLSRAHYSKQASISVEIADLRASLHIPSGKLSNFSDLDRFVLIPAMMEINSYASFAVKFHTKRKGMKVTHLIFDMHSKRNLFEIDDARHVIPLKRPRLFINNPELERAYANLLNAETKERRKYFDMAVKLALKKNHKIEEDEFDRPDLWFKWVEKELINNTF
jgi:hypothetical protein